MIKLNSCVKSKKTGKRGIIQGIFDNDLFLLFHGTGYEHLKSIDMVEIRKKNLPFRYDIYTVKYQ